MPSESPLHIPDANGNKVKRTVPKFASFRAKGAPQNQASVHEALPPAHSASASQDISVRVSDTRNETTNPDKHLRRDREEHREGKEGNQYVTSHLLAEDPGAGGRTDKLFVVDRVGDPNNLRFGVLHRYATPSYLRLGAGNLLGLSREQKIDRSASDEKCLILSHRKYELSRKGGRPTMWIPSGNLRRELKIRPQAKQFPDIDATLDFVSLSAARRVKRRRGNHGSSLDSESSSVEDSTHYRSIEGKAKSHYKPADRDLTFNDDASSVDDQNERLSPMGESAQDRRGELSSRTEADPGNYVAWLNLIDNQDEILQVFRTSRSRGLTNAEKQANADVKLSIYQKALEKVTDPVGRENLILSMTDQAAQVWTSEKLSSHLKSLLQDNPGFLRLWTKYLNFTQTNFTTFKYEEVVAVYFECLNFLSRVLQDGMKSIAEKEQIYDIQLYVLLRMTLFLRESGFTELAVAAWQAMLEYVFFKPVQFHSKEHKGGGSLHHTTLSMFEEFWDSEVPRIGENDAEGWATYSHKQGDATQPKIRETHPTGIVQNLWQSWLLTERRHGLLARNPARTIDDVEESDPYRVILFSDIQPFLIDCPSQMCQATLLDAFLAFCYLPTRGSAPQPKTWREDGFLRNESLYSSGSILPTWGIQRPNPQLRPSDEVDGQENFWDSSSRNNALKFPGSVYQPSSDSSFSTKGSWFSPLDAWETEYSEERGPLEKRWVIRAVKTLVLAGIGGDNLAELLLALELRFCPENVRKTSKTLLKRQPSNLRLYNAYALVEYRLGNPSKAETVVVTSINMGEKFNENPQRPETLLLWHTWIWELLSAGKPQDALKRLLEYGSGEIRPVTSEREVSSTKPALLLRAEKALTATRDHLLSHNHPATAVLSISLLTLLTYLTTHLSLPAAQTTFKTNLALLPPPPHPALELHHQHFARLLHHHTTHRHPYQPSLLRSTLAESITAFPNNTIFLSLYTHYETLNDRVRSIVHDTLPSHHKKQQQKPEESLTTHLFAIYTELHRSLTLGSNINTIRSAFERAVEKYEHCAGLWKLFFMFEISRGGGGNADGGGRAKAVYWRAVRACPWVKELYLLAFEYLREGMGEDELRGVYGMMEEKGLRLHVALEDFLEERGESAGGGG